MRISDWSSDVCSSDLTDDILLATAGGKCIRFSVSDVRVFAGRTPTGVRGIKLAQGAEGDDRVISMSILRSGEAESIEERDAYLRSAHPQPHSQNGGGGGPGGTRSSEQRRAGINGGQHHRAAWSPSH